MRDAHNRQATLWLPFPPSTNTLFNDATIKSKGRMVRRRMPTKRYRLWSRDVHATLLLKNIATFLVPAVIQLELTPPDKRRRDCTNYVKAVEDELVKARILLGDDGRYVKAVAVWWAESNGGPPGVRVTIRPARMATQEPG